jgi:hypothetical protein
MLEGTLIMNCRILILLVLLSSSVFSWDGQRKGFVAGFDIANGIIFWQPTYMGNFIDLRPIVGKFNTNYLFNANFKLGYSPVNKFEIQNYFKLNLFNQTPNNIGYVMTYGFDFSYFILPISPSYFINLTCGLSNWSRPANPGVNEFHMGGQTLSLGFGKEIIRHFYALLEFFYINGQVSSFQKEFKGSGNQYTGFGEYKNEAFGINLVLGVSGY